MEEKNNVAQDLLHILWKISNTVRKHNNPTRRLSLTESLVCASLGENELNNGEPYKVNQLSEIVGISNSSMVRLLNSLEDKGCIERYQKSNDRRSVYIRLSEQAKEDLASEKEKLYCFANFVAERLGYDKAEELVQNMTELNSLLEEALRKVDGRC